MKGSSAGPGGPLKSKPTWGNTPRYSPTSVFFAFRGQDRLQLPREKSMNQAIASRAQQIAQAASAFEQQRTGHLPRSVTVVLSEDTLVITLRGALSPAEIALAQSPTAAAQMQEFHRQLFA